MTFVNRRVAIEYQSYVPQNEKFHAKKQIPSIVSMLTRLVYFHDKHTEPNKPNNIDNESKEKKTKVYKRDAKKMFPRKRNFWKIFQQNQLYFSQIVLMHPKSDYWSTQLIEHICYDWVSLSHKEFKNLICKKKKKKQK